MLLQATSSLLVDWQIGGSLLDDAFNIADYPTNLEEVQGKPLVNPTTAPPPPRPPWVNPRRLLTQGPAPVLRVHPRRGRVFEIVACVSVRCASS